MELQNGRPADAAGRMNKEIRTYDFLDGLGVDYQRMDHEAAFTMEACKEVDEALGVEMCKNLFLCNRQKTDFYLLLIPGDKVFKTKELSKQIGSARLSFADYEKTHQLSAARDVADPWYTGDFDATYDDILRGCRGLLAYISGGI